MSEWCCYRCIHKRRNPITGEHLCFHYKINLTGRERYCPDRETLSIAGRICPICGHETFRFLGEDWYGCNHCDSYMQIKNNAIVSDVLTGKEFKRKVLSKFRKQERAKAKEVITKAKEEGIVKDYESGLRVKDIARKYRLSGGEIYYILKKRKVKLRKKEYR